jgi:energy-coupling factor transporter ATP-binding protein EcfA2
MVEVQQDKFLKIFCSRVKEDIFHPITHHNQIWQPDPYDIGSIHQESRDCFERLLNRINVLEKLDSGRIMLLLGNSGAGKTHLMRAFRNYTHEKALGYFAYMQMTSSVSNYASYALHYTIDSFDKPYCESSGGMTGLMHLSNALIERRNIISQSDIDKLRNDELNRNELNDLIYKIADDILNKERDRFQKVELDLVRALLYLQNDEPATHARVRKYLRCENMSEYDCKMLGNIMPRIQEDDPDRLLQALAHLMMAINSGAFIICLDQLEDIHPADEAEIKFRRAMEKMTKLAEIPNVIVVIACLQSIYKLLKDHLPHSQRDRIEHDKIFIKAERNEAEIRKLINVRLQDLYDIKRIDSNVDNSIYPFKNETPALLAGMSTRQILEWCRQQREQSIRTGALPQLTTPDENPPNHSNLPSELPSQSAILRLSQLWNDYFTGPHSVPVNENEMLQLLKRAIEHCAAELNNTYKFHIVQRDDFFDIDIQNTGRNIQQHSTLGLCQKSPQGGSLARQIDQLQTIADKRTAIAIRSVDFPSDPKTKIAMRLGEFVAKGGKKVMVSDSDWRMMVAMESFRSLYEQKPEFLDWLSNVRPLLSLPSFQQILALEYIVDEPKPGPEPSDSSRLKIGMVQGFQPYPFEIEVSQFVRHAAFLGSSGSGKTTLALNIIEQLLLQNIPAILLDRKGDLCSYAKEEAWRSSISDPVRAQMRKSLYDKVEVIVYTPGAIEGQGRPLSIPIIPKGLGNLSSGEREQLANNAAFSLGRILGYKEFGQDKSRIIILGQAISILSELNPNQALTINQLIDFIDNEDPRLLNAIGKLEPKLFKQLVQDLQTLALGHGNLFTQSGELLSTESLFGYSSDNKKTRIKPA